MNDPADEEKLLHSTALRNVQSILQAKQRAEAELASSQAQFAAIIHHSPLGILLVDAQLRMRQANSSAQPMLAGFAPVDGRDLWELLAFLCPEPAATELFEHFRDALATGEPYVCHGFSGFRERGGSRRHYDIELQRLNLAEGRHGVVCYLTDITEHARAQANERANAERLQLALAAGRLGDWSWEAGTDAVSLGPRAAEILRIPPDTPTNWTTVLEAVHPQDREQFRIAVEAAARDVSEYEIEFRLDDPSQEDERWIAAKGRGVSPDGGGASVVGILQDVTDRKLFDADLRRSEEELRTLADSIPQLSWIANGEGEIYWYNRGWYQYTGTTREQMRGDGWHSVHDPTVLPRVLESWRRSLRTGEPFEMEYPLRRADGEYRWFLTRASPIRDAGGHVVRWFGTNTDVHDVRRAAQEREHLLDAERGARAELERVSLMKDAFLATLSHELRTPLNAIVGWSQVLRMRGHVDPDVLEGLSVIDRNAKVQAQLIEDLLDMSRIISGKVRLDVQRVDIQDVARAAIASVRLSAEAKDIRIQAVLDPMVGPVWGDPARLQQCFWNLLSNSIKFTPRGGSVQASLSSFDSSLEFTVTDSGQGITADFLPHVFERFRQADASTTRRHGGLGLGLSIVRTLVELHGGSVHATSEGENLGATFSIELPVMIVGESVSERLRKLAPADLQRQPGRKHPSLRGVTVLAVDDEADARGLVKRILEDCGARVFLAESVRSGLEILQREKPDVLISDIGMPNEDGYTFIREVRKLKPGQGGRVPAAALSAFARPQDRARALSAGYQLHLSKPVDPTELTVGVASLTMRK